MQQIDAETRKNTISGLMRATQNGASIRESLIIIKKYTSIKQKMKVAPTIRNFRCFNFGSYKRPIEKFKDVSSI